MGLNVLGACVWTYDVP